VFFIIKVTCETTPDMWKNEYFVSQKYSGKKIQYFLVHINIIPMQYSRIVVEDLRNSVLSHSYNHWFL
jgi:hypothetical protein